MASRPTITVTADPDALKAAMDALTAYDAALTTYEAATAEASEIYEAAIAEASETYAAATAEAKAELESAEKAAEAAGVSFPARSTATASTRRSASGTRVTAAQVRANVMATAKGTTSFRLIEVQGGGSPATLRSVVKALVDEGALVELGPDPEHNARGRAPIMYARA